MKRPKIVLQLLLVLLPCEYPLFGPRLAEPW